LLHVKVNPENLATGWRAFFIVFLGVGGGGRCFCFFCLLGVGFGVILGVARALKCLVVVGL